MKKKEGEGAASFSQKKNLRFYFEKSRERKTLLLRASKGYEEKKPSLEKAGAALLLTREGKCQET